jgi:hypothetical protein
MALVVWVYHSNIKKKAARWRQPKMCNILINEGANLNATDDYGRYLGPINLMLVLGIYGG